MKALKLWPSVALASVLVLLLVPGRPTCRPTGAAVKPHVPGGVTKGGERSASPTVPVSRRPVLYDPSPSSSCSSAATSGGRGRAVNEGAGPPPPAPAGPPPAANVTPPEAAGLRRLLAALREVESGGDAAAVGDGGRSVGPYQCGLAAWLDGGGRRQDYPRLAFDRLATERVMVAYWRRYGAVTDEQRARIWNGGPAGLSKPATLSYWRRVAAQLRQPQGD